MNEKEPQAQLEATTVTFAPAKSSLNRAERRALKFKHQIQYGNPRARNAYAETIRSTREPRKAEW